MILVRAFTEADDVAGFYAARGILTSEGGKASHAALVARGMGRPAVTGAAEVVVDEAHGEIRIGEHVVLGGRRADRDRRQPWHGHDRRRPLVEPEIDEQLQTVLGLGRRAAHPGRARERRHATDARKASELGAEGIGLCRTEHMLSSASASR